MRRYLAPLFALCYLASTIIAQAGFLINSYSVVSGGAVLPSLTFVGCTIDNTAQTTYTTVGQSIGTAGATRTVIIIALSRDGTTDFSTSSMTIGGVSASEQADTASTARSNQVAVYSLNVSSGTTADVAVTYSEAITVSVICVFAAYDLNSSTKVASTTAVSTTTLTLDANVSANGIVVGGCDNNTVAGFTWSGLNEEIDATDASNYTVADITVTPASTPLAISCTGGGSIMAGASVTFR